MMVPSWRCPAIPSQPSSLSSPLDLWLMSSPARRMIRRDRCQFQQGLALTTETEFPGQLRTDHDASVVVPCERQGTAMLSTLTGSDGFIVLEHRDIVLPCELVDFIPLQGIYPRSIQSRPRLLATPSWLEPFAA